MSRTRSLSPDFWTCEAVVDCSPMARLLLLGLQNFADDFGVQPLRPRTIKMQVFPGDALDAEAVRALIEELASHGLLRLYSVDGQDYIAIVDWQHQQRVGKCARRRYPDISEVHQGLTSDAPSAETMEIHSNPPGDAAPPPRHDGRDGLADAIEIHRNPPGTLGPCFETTAVGSPQHEVGGGPEGSANHSNPPPVSGVPPHPKML